MAGSRLHGGDRGRGRGVAGAALAAAFAVLGAPAAHAHTVHTALPGESLSSIAAAHGTTADAIASASGLSTSEPLPIGQEVTIPTPAESGLAPAPDPAAAVAQGMVAIHHPSTTPYLAPEAAAAWEAMRQESLATYGVDLYPIGASSGYRTYEQQAYFYDLYLSGLGNPASPPGSSSHESGNAVDVASPEMRDVVDEIGAAYGWVKVEAPTEWWHVTYVGGYGG